MIPVLIKSVLRSVFVGSADHFSLRAAGIGNVFAQKVGLGLVLAGALAIPLLIPLPEPLHLQSANSGIVRPAYSMTLLQELQAMLQARGGSGLLPRPFVAPVPENSPQAEKSSRRAPGSAPAPAAQEPRPSGTEPAPRQAESVTNSVGAGETQPVPQPDRVAFSPSAFAFLIYLAVGVLPLLRPVSTLSRCACGLRMRAR